MDTFNMGTETTFERFLKVDEPALFRVDLFGRQYVNVILSTTDVHIIADGNKPNGTFEITGSVDTENVQEINQTVKEFERTVQSLNAAFMAARNNNENGEVTRLQQEYINIKNEHDRTLKDKLWNMGNSIAVIIAMYQYMDGEKDFMFYDSIASKFKRELPNSSYTKELSLKVEGLRRLAVGSMAPEIELPNPDGKLVSLSSFKGQYVMIDFWAAWCKPCRLENPNVVRMYDKYHNKGFEILGVSLDRKRADWLKAIADDKLTWPHVSDLKYFRSVAAETYAIRSIPATYLIGPDGKIIAKGLRGASLEAKLEEIFG